MEQLQKERRNTGAKGLYSVNHNLSAFTVQLFSGHSNKRTELYCDGFTKDWYPTAGSNNPDNNLLDI